VFGTVDGKEVHTPYRIGGFQMWNGKISLVASQERLNRTCKHAACRPYVDAGAVAGGAKQQLWGAVPPGKYLVFVCGVGWSWVGRVGCGGGLGADDCIWA